MKIPLAIAFALVASGAQAQQQVTRCSWEGREYVCREDRARPGLILPDTSQIMERGRRAFEDGQRQQQQIQDAINARRNEQAQREAQDRAANQQAQLYELELRRARAEAEAAELAVKRTREEGDIQAGIEAVQKLIRDGDCQGAIALAKLNWGERGERDARELCPN
jgi:hypothetical protein